MELVRLPSGNGISSLALLPTADPAQLDRLLLSFYSARMLFSHFTLGLQFDAALLDQLLSHIAGS